MNEQTGNLEFGIITFMMAVIVIATHISKLSKCLCGQPEKYKIHREISCTALYHN